MKIFFRTEVAKREMLKRGFSVTEFARVLGITRTSLGGAINRRNGISPKNSQIVLEYLGKNFDDIFEIVE